MKCLVLILFACLISVALSDEEPCPPGEHRVASTPDCDLGHEPRCPVPAHSSRTNDCLKCWCAPGTLRVLGAGCVTLENCPVIRPY